METKDSPGIEQILQYEFNDKDLLQEALRHSSFVNELGEPHLRDNNLSWLKWRNRLIWVCTSNSAKARFKPMDGKRILFWQIPSKR